MHAFWCYAQLQKYIFCKNRITVRNGITSETKSTLQVKFIFISQGQTDPTLQPTSQRSLPRHHIHIFTVQNTTQHRIDRSTNKPIERTIPTHRFLRDEMLLLLCLRYDLPMYIKCESHHGLHSTVNQPTQTHKLHCYSD